jgi:EpsD family peptidyl-prolyl cis-trans isomerase
VLARAHAPERPQVVGFSRARVACVPGFRNFAAPPLAFSNSGEQILLNVSRNLRNRWRVAAVICALAAAGALAGCGKKQDTQAIVGQVIAHVGPDDITQQEVDNELRLAGIPADKRSDEVVKAVLSRIIERKYLVQQAVAAKLDREPSVHLDLLRAHEQVLASAFVQRDLGTRATGISKSETDAYIQAHPIQFANRQQFQIDQLSFAPLPQRDMEALGAATKDDKSLDQVQAKLNQMNIKYSRGTGVMDTATLPPEIEKAIEARKPDDVFFLRSRTAASYFKVASADDKPLTGEEADRFAKRMLTEDLAKKTAQETSAAALAGAKYEGDYARIMAQTPAAPAAAASEAPGAEKPGETQNGDKADAQKEAPKN